MDTGTITGTLLGSPFNATITGNTTTPTFQGTITNSSSTSSNTREHYDLARAAMVALMNRPEGLILTTDEMATKAWDIAAAMMRAANQHGQYI